MNRYGSQHRAIRRRMLPFAVGQRCVRCGEPIREGQAIDLDHTDDGTGYLGFACASCNRSAGATAGNRARGRRKKAKDMKDTVLGVDIATDRSHTSIVAAGRLDSGEVAFELTYLDGSDTAADVLALAVERSTAVVVVDPRSPASTLIAPLKALGVNVTTPTTHDMAVAHGRFLDEFRAGRLRYVAHPALTLAAQHADTRPLAGGEALERRKVDADASPLTAAELAVWAVICPPPVKQIFAY